MTQAVTLVLHEIVPALEPGIRVGPSELRYEHLRAAHASSTGRAAVVSLLLRVAQGKLRCGIAEACLTALLKGGEVADGLRPVASGEVLRRVAGWALIQVKQEEIERKLLAFNQFAF